MDIKENYFRTQRAVLVDTNPAPRRAWNRSQILRPCCARRLRLVSLACLIAFYVYTQWRHVRPATNPRATNPDFTAHGLSVKQLREDVLTCSKLHSKAANPPGFGREKSDRYVDGTRSTLIKNATVWVGEPAAGRGYSWVEADVFLEYGLIKEVGRDLQLHEGQRNRNITVYDAAGRPLTSGLIDMHSHAGVHSLPTLRANDDTSELSSNIAPYVRSIDGIQPTDRQLQVIKSGGVTTSLVLPGSGNNIGGEAFVIKHAVGRDDGRSETSIADMLADRTQRHMKMACGENPKHFHGKIGERGPTSRLGESWELRHAFEQAARILRAQDDWCNAATTSLGLDGIRTYLPSELKWEPLVAVLRGQVHVHVHCYTIPDLEAFVGHTNEFNFSVRAFHHAHQTYLVPEILKRAWGDSPPASALFADNMWYKAEAYIGSEYAGKYLYDSDLVPIYVSDNPVLNAQHLVSEAGKGYRYGLPYYVAFAAVTTAPAERLGLDQRLGKIKPGFDADVVVWDSDPLSLGATPVQVWVDGAAQYENPVELNKPFRGTIVPNKELANIVEDGVAIQGDVIFTGLSKDLLSIRGDKDSVDAGNDKTFNVAVSGGRITCIGKCDTELKAASEVVRLKNGYLTPAATAFGSTLGLNAVDSEGDTDNGDDGDGAFSRAVDGLAFGTKKLRASYRYGVTRAISAPKFAGGATHHGTSAGFLTGAHTAFTPGPGAVFSDDVAVHYTLDLSVKRGGDSTPSVSAAVGNLRRKLLEAVALSMRRSRTMSSSLVEKVDVDVEAADWDQQFSETAFLLKVIAGEMPLVVSVHSADAIAALLRVKTDVEKAQAEMSSANGSMPGSLVGKRLRLVVVGGAEAHLLAAELSAAEVGVVLAPMLSFAVSWDQRRALAGAPLTNGTAIDVLIDAGVLTAIGLEEDWVVRDLGLLAGISHRNGEGRLTEKEALDLIGHNVYKILGLEQRLGGEGHFVIHEGNPLDIDSRVKAVGGGTGQVDVY